VEDLRRYVRMDEAGPIESGSFFIGTHRPPLPLYSLTW
jgi:hypothetical protein